MNWLAVFVGGGIGSILRFGISKFPLPFSFPLNTFISNIVACTLLGLTIYFIKPQHPFWQTFILIGICGGLSTFSTFSKETLDLFQSGNSFVAIANIVISIGTCVGIIGLLNK